MLHAYTARNTFMPRYAMYLPYLPYFLRTFSVLWQNDGCDGFRTFPSKVTEKVTDRPSQNDGFDRWTFLWTCRLPFHHLNMQQHSHLNEQRQMAHTQANLFITWRLHLYDYWCCELLLASAMWRWRWDMSAICTRLPQHTVPVTVGLVLYAYRSDLCTGRGQRECRGQMGSRVTLPLSGFDGSSSPLRTSLD